VLIFTTMTKVFMHMRSSYTARVIETRNLLEIDLENKWLYQHKCVKIVGENEQSVEVQKVI
jgi:hypothetical protein